MGLLRRRAQLACCIVMLGLTGCSSVRLYDSTRDHQGEAARKAWSEVDLKATIDAERGNLQKLLAAELTTQQNLATAIRDHELRSMVRSKSVSAGLVEPLEKRLMDLAGTLTPPSNVNIAMTASQAIISSHQARFMVMGLPPPQCDAIADGVTPKYIQTWLASQSAVRKRVVTSLLGDLRLECDKNLSEASIYSPLRGAISTAWREYKNAAKDLNARKMEVQDLQVAYDIARDAYDRAVADASVDPHSDANVKAAAGRIHAVVLALEASSNPFAAKLLAEERLKSIDALAQAITEAQPGQPIPQGASKAATAFTAIPEFFDEARIALAEARKPLTVPLLIRRNYERLNLEAAKRHIAGLAAIADLSHALVLSLYRQATQLANADAALNRPDVKLVHNKALYDAFKTSGMDVRAALYRAAALYLDAVNRLDAERYQIEYMRQAAHHDRALAYAEVNVKQWESLIGTTVDQVADYSASGFKPEQIANLLNTLGIFYIGRGVNK